MENEKEFHLETFNYKYNSWLPVEIIDKLDEKIIKIRCYVYKDMHDKDGVTWRELVTTFETCAFWKHIRTIKK